MAFGQRAEYTRGQVMLKVRETVSAKVPSRNEFGVLEEQQDMQCGWWRVS